ncbi:MULTISPECIES: hypothetical protein [unclassified Pseudomonas]|uniref:hypothetical protein n=1 Tax=unclassified Pseudomonas TaxID=196821 RepID=UPI000D378E4F|nr:MULTISPECIES: hypothetical protein [unclassified Pseudomonas]RAU43694.1 hypothetical protein DBP26_019390 [Pseudomonas sp. RIT 409]RAU54374.1 hypothetical protein DBY65_008580 [Pseudomonas sp. RIT 412]
MQKVRIRFAYKQGFRRVWLIISLLWLLFVGFAGWRRAEGVIGEFFPTFLQIGVLPVVALYLFGVICVWIIEGFARADR